MVKKREEALYTLKYKHCIEVLQDFLEDKDLSTTKIILVEFQQYVGGKLRDIGGANDQDQIKNLSKHGGVSRKEQNNPQILYNFTINHTQE